MRAFNWENHACCYVINPEEEDSSRVYIESREQVDGSNKWVVKSSNFVLSTEEKDFVYEPSPSNRTADFCKATRFQTKEDALVHYFLLKDSIEATKSSKRR